MNRSIIADRQQRQIRKGDPEREYVLDAKSVPLTLGMILPHTNPPHSLIKI